MSWREFRRNKGKKVLYWKIIQNENSYTTEHGQLGTSNPQTFSDTPGPKGKENTKAYVNAFDNCTFHVEREIRKKTEHGYVEYIDGKAVVEEIIELNFNKQLPKNFCSYKPQTSVKDSTLIKIHKAENALYTRKYDGMMHLAVHHTWGWEIYTRRMDLTSDRFPNHIKALNNFKNLSIGTILTGEMVCHTPEEKDDFKAISRVCRSDPKEARKLIDSKECIEPTYRIFDIIYYNGKPLSEEKFADRRSIWKNELNIAQHDNLSMIKLIDRVEIFNVTPDTWEDYAKEKGWEGFVIVDKTSIPGDKLFSFDGDAKRPKGHYKLKPVHEDDVVIYAGLKGSGKRLGTVGSILVKQIHPETGKWFRCGKVGSGFEDEDIIEIKRELEKADLPLFDKEKEDKGELGDEGIVAMIEYSERQIKTNKFRFPVFIRLRTDKAPKECVAQRMAPEDE